MQCGGAASFLIDDDDEVCAEAMAYNLDSLPGEEGKLVLGKGAVLQLPRSCGCCLGKAVGTTLASLEKEKEKSLEKDNRKPLEKGLEPLEKGPNPWKRVNSNRSQNSCMPAGLP